MSDDWRFDGETGTDAGDYFLGQRKRLDLDKRRPVIRRASDLVGPGIGASAVKVTDWNNILATFNGYYASVSGALHAPNTIENFVGHTVMDSTLGGTQVVTGMASQTQYKRVFLRNPSDEESIVFGAWMPQPTIQAGSAVVTMFQTGRVDFPTPFMTTPVVTMTGGNGEGLAFIYGVAQPDPAGFSFYANTNEGGAGSGITSGPVRVNWIAVGQ